MTETSPTNSELAQRIAGAVDAVLDAHETLVDGAKKLAAHLADDTGHITGAALHDGPIDFDDSNAVAELAESVPLGGIVAYDCQCPTDGAVVIGGDYNSGEIIIESGEWVAPVSGWYEVEVVSGGNGGVSTAYRIAGGISGNRSKKLMFLTKDTSYPVVIGAGGQGIYAGDAYSLCVGGVTSFNSFVPDNNHSGAGVLDIEVNTAESAFQRVFGGGPGTGGATPTDMDAFWYGGGGSAIRQYENNTWKYYSGAGYQGCAILRWHDAAKDKMINIDMGASATISGLAAEIAALKARVEELENG